MKEVRFAILIAVFGSAALLSGSPASAAGGAGESRPALPVTARADVAVRRQSDGATMLLLSGGVELSRGASRMEADRVLIRIDERRSRRLGRVVMSVYGEGKVQTVEKGTRVISPRVFFHWTASDFTVDDADGFIAVREKPFSGPFIKRAETVRKRGAVPVTPRAIPPKKKTPTAALPPGKTPDTGIIEPTRIGLIYGQQQEGPDIKSSVEGDYRVTVLTRYPDIVFYDPGSALGKMEVRAENMVIWVNEKKLKEGGLLQEAELEIYAEGHVVIHQDRKTVHCEQLYYDYKNRRGLLVGGPGGDAVIKTYSVHRQIPILYRAKEFRQVSAEKYLAKDAILTTCEFGHPEWGIYAKEMSLTAGMKTATDGTGRVGRDDVTESVEVRHARFVAHGIPMFYWPRFTRDLKNEQTPLQSLRLVDSNDMGFGVQTEWNLYDFGIYKNDWSKCALLADYFSRRGLGLGVRFEYERPEYWGELIAYGIHDHGTDMKNVPLEKEHRLRFNWWHRQPLSDHWRMDAELSWLSDRNFLNEYWEQVFKEGKEQESLLYLRYLKDNRYLGLTARWRLNYWQTQNEQMPEAHFAWVGQPILGDRVTYIQETRLGNMRRRWDDDAQSAGLLPADYRSWRLFTEHEFQYPLRLGIFRVAPFVNLAYGWYERPASGDHDRVTVTTGVRSSTTFWRIYDFYNRLWDINRLRHVVTPTLDVFGTFVRTKPPSEIPQFDEADALDDTKVIRLGLRQRLQTRRLGRTEEPARVSGWRNVNWMLLDLEIDYFPQASRHNNGRELSPLRMDYRWRISDRISLISDADVRVEDGPNIETFDVGLLLNRSPKLSLYLGQRYTDASGSNIFIGKVDYKLNERWTLAFFTHIDLGAPDTSDYMVVFRRRMHRWIAELVLERDSGEDDTSAKLLFTPQGIPEAKFRFY